MLFRDWSVRKVGIKEIWTLNWHKQFDTSGPWTKAGGVQREDWPEWMRGFKVTDPHLSGPNEMGQHGDGRDKDAVR